MSKTIYEKIWYLPTFLQSKVDTTCTLIGHIYTIRKSDMGNYSLKNKLDAWEFPDESALAQFITKNKAKELPTEAAGQPMYVPDRIKSKLSKLKA